MSTNRAAHGEWCNSRTYQMRCRYCGAEVFYFQCNCGCKVFFDSLGVPWPEHQCLESKIHVYGKANVEKALQLGMALPGYTHRGDKIERQYQEKVRRQREADRKAVRETVAIAPPSYLDKETHCDLGRLTEIVEHVDAFRRAHLDPDNPIAAALLREFTREDMCQITLIVDDVSMQDRESYTCWGPRSILRESGAHRGDLVEFELRVVDHLVLGCIWVCKRITAIF